MNDEDLSAGTSALFVGAHPDDVELFCGATVACLASARQRIVIADLTRGELATNGTPQQRREDSLRAAAALGAAGDRPVLGLPDGGLDARDAEQVRAVVALIRRIRPRLLVGPWTDDRHPDHVAAGELVRRANFLAGLARFAPELGAVHRAVRVLHYPCHHDTPVDLVVDVTAAMTQWRASLAAYGSQFLPTPGGSPTPINRPGFLAAAEARRAHWGNLRGVDFAEGFRHEGPWLLSGAELLGSEETP